MSQGTNTARLTNSAVNVIGGTTALTTNYGLSSIGCTGSNFDISSTGTGGGTVTIGSIGTGNVTLGQNASTTIVNGGNIAIGNGDVTTYKTEIFSPVVTIGANVANTTTTIKSPIVLMGSTTSGAITLYSPSINIGDTGTFATGIVNVGANSTIVNINRNVTGTVNIGSTTGTTTINSSTTNISTTGATTVNIGNTGTTSTAASIVNIGTGATGINIGNSATLFNVVGKVRLSSNPVLSYYFTVGQTQNIPDVTNTVLKYPTSETRNATGTGITYSTTDGIFTNSNSYSVVIVVSATVLFPSNSSGVRVLSIINSFGTAAFNQVNANSSTDLIALNASSTFILKSDETFYANVYQNTGGILTIPANTVNRINVLVL